jgi:hypothetical protein
MQRQLNGGAKLPLTCSAKQRDSKLWASTGSKCPALVFSGSASFISFSHVADSKCVIFHIRWAELGWVELGWVELGWVELGWVELGWVELGWVELS